MSASTRVLILPGRGNSGAKHWQSVWQDAHPEFVRVLQRDWDNPDADEWVAALDAAIQIDPAPVVLVAHSLAVVTVTHWAARHRGPVAGALLVSPTDVERADYPPGTSGFVPVPQQRLPFPSIVVASEDDPRVSLERARAFSAAWGSRLQVAGALGHLGTASDLGAWPFGAALLDELLHASVQGIPAS
ncbi:MAG: alpha/beta fold hydrolase [Pseudoxanthomonas sp.]